MGWTEKYDQICVDHNWCFVEVLIKGYVPCRCLPHLAAQQFSILAARHLGTLASIWSHEKPRISIPAFCTLVLPHGLIVVVFCDERFYHAGPLIQSKLSLARASNIMNAPNV